MSREEQSTGEKRHSRHGPDLLSDEPRVQLSLDFQSLDDALPVADTAVRAGVDWLEVGTPLILGEGLRAVRALRERYPNHPIIADLKTMDAGYLEAEMMYGAGATFVVVMARAHEQTIRDAVRAATTYDSYVMGDIMLCEDKAAAAARLTNLGVDIIVVHTGFDERHAVQGASPIDDLAQVRAATDLPLQAVGGLSLTQAAQCPGLGASVAVIGAPLAVADHEFKPGAKPEQLLHTIQQFVDRVKQRA